MKTTYLTEAELKSAAESYIAEQSKNESNKEIIETEAGANESVIEEDDLDVEEETVDESDELDESTESSTEEDVSEGEEDGSTSDEVDDSIVEDVEPDNLDAQDEDLTAEDYLGILLDAAQEQNLTIRAIFESMDLDDDGVIDGPELQSGINEIAGEYLSPGEIMSIISLVDKDSDGRVNALELIDIIESMDVELESDRTKNPNGNIS